MGNSQLTTQSLSVYALESRGEKLSRRRTGFSLEGEWRRGEEREGRGEGRRREGGG